ncbi:MAG: hypothetical protein ABSF50_22460 [Burkholderiaceae bacterium]|jgi:hypothetical protein
MKKISSNSLFFTKRIFPVIWFGFLIFFASVPWVSGHHQIALAPIVFACVMGAFGFVLMKKLVWDLVDEVYDGGDYLLVKNGGIEGRIELANVMNVGASVYTNPPRVTLRLAEPCAFGTEVSFSPARSFTLNPFARNRIVDDLIERADAARTRRLR